MLGKLSVSGPNLIEHVSCTRLDTTQISLSSSQEPWKEVSFHLLAMMMNAAMSVYVQLFLCGYVFSFFLDTLE